MNRAPAADEITAMHLLPAVNRQLGRGRATLLDFQVEQIKGGIGNPVSLGLHRVEYQAEVDGRSQSGSLILKIIQSPANVGARDMGEGDDPHHWNYWRREPLFYQSDLVHRLPAGLTAPTCYHTATWDDDIMWLWLEDLGPWSGPQRPPADLAAIGRALGRLNGRFTGPDSLPADDWLGRDLLIQIVNRIPGHMDHPLFEAAGRLRWDHPVLVDLFPPATGGHFRTFLDRIDDVLAALNRLPACWCHGDGNPYNFVLRAVAGGREVVAMDWAMTGISVPGKDLAQLVAGSLELFGPAGSETAIRPIFDAYVEGLAEGGRPVDPDQVRLGYAAAAVMDYGLFFVFFLGLGLAGPDAQPQAISDQQRASARFIDDVARQALELMATLGGK